ncbi:anaphase-promoting complex subunit 5 [Paraburkholderia sp. BL27I4N3]|uniref:tetratricopeptide repeat protein n=1 Tax=Paraburkholderia sp. BL27I4N3 TaxID=1938805 RepID=UPI000E26B3C7|nr:tetratricopeptide repeat protein [Paraburkholderia sp. BL27I4N3]REE17126.1 anaphase-promoting complex subunit 5 [Paraburkholderia sp. BL27I4N3]
MQQEASIAGAGNTVVQIVGDGNTVTTGHPPHLTLTRYVARRQIRQDLDRLSPYARSTPLLGRETELASLHTFLREPRDLLARVLVGDGGCGKTRLALELCEQASTTGWNAGFVTRTELQRFFREQNLSDWGWQKPTLIVVDYAAEHAELLSQWLNELTDRAAAAPHVLRLLLLERNASTDTGWWTTVFASGGWGVLNKRALLDPPEPVPIPPLGRAEDRLALLGTVLAQANPGQPIDLPVHDAAFRDKLMQLVWGGDPLFLMMAALAMVQVGHARALALGRIDLADALAQHEADRLRQLARVRSLDPALVQHLAACVTLAQGMSREDFERFASSEKATIHRPSGGDAAVLADVLQEALPRANGIAPVLPDLIGEALIMRTMRQNPGAAAVLRCHAAFGRAVAESVIRCAQDFAPQSPAPLRWLEGIMHALDDEEDELAALDDSLPMESVVLSDLNLKVAERLQALCVAREDAPMPRRAAVLNRLATARGMAGQPEAALGTAEEAVDLYRELVAQQPEVFRPDLARSLSNLAVRLNALGQREPALQAAQEATDLNRELADQWPDVFRPDLAGSLNNLANSLSELGQREPALQAAQEAVDIRRELADQRPDVFRPDLARSLQTLASRLSELGQREPALQAAQEAVDIRREFAAQRPDVFRPDLAASLGTLANRFSELGQREPALQAAQEATDLYRELADRWPEVFRPELAMTLNNLANSLSELGQREPALQAAQEVTDLYRELADQRPEVFRPGLAMSLNNLANSLNELGQRKLALQVAQEATDLYREFATQRPDVFRPDLAMSLSNLANRLSELGHREPAWQAALEAADLYSKLADQRPDVFRPDLARSLIVLALRTRDVSGAAEALPLAQEAVTTLALEFLRRPDAHAQLMGAMLRDYLQLCDSARATPDLELLGPLLPYFTNKE